MRYLARFNLFAAFRDLGTFFRTRQKHEWVAAVAALLVTGYILWALDMDSYAERLPEIVYVNSWPVTRTDDEIKTEITAASVERHRQEKARQAEYKKLADMLGIDTTPPKP